MGDASLEEGVWLPEVEAAPPRWPDRGKGELGCSTKEVRAAREDVEVGAPPALPTPPSGHILMREGARVCREGAGGVWEGEVSAAATAAAAGASPSPPPPTRAYDVAYSLVSLPCCQGASTDAGAAELWVGSMPRGAALVKEGEAGCAGGAMGGEEEEEGCVRGEGGKDSKSGELFTWNSWAVSAPKCALSLLAASALSFPATPTATPMACTASAMCLKKGALRRSAARVRSLAAWG